jgi:hypothetical protein
VFVVGSPSLNAADAAIRDRLVATGWTVELADDDTVTADATVNRQVVVVSASIEAFKVGNKLTAVPVPVVNAEPNLFDKLGFSTGSDKGVISGVTELVSGGAPPVVVTTRAETFSWATPNANATTIATERTTGRTVLARYERGAAMVTGTASARRASLFLNTTTATGLTPAGWTLVDETIAWAASPPP